MTHADVVHWASKMSSSEPLLGMIVEYLLQHESVYGSMYEGPTTKATERVGNYLMAYLN